MSCTQIIEKPGTVERTTCWKPEDSEYEMVFKSPLMKRTIEKLDRIAATPSTVLITGESGTGKELAARRIHSGTSCPGPFLALNLAGIPENLIESELFGYEKGAFTGASCRKAGLMETAAGGTIFLDEIGEISPAMQVKMLRVLQDKTIRRLGGISDIPVNARIITATNRDMEEMVSRGEFREDLYYRLNVARVHLPPLRERPEDIERLASHIIDKLNHKFQNNIEGLSPAALRQLERYAFPGNIRELENILENGFIFASGPILEELETDRFGKTESMIPFPAGTLKELEYRAVLDALKRWNGNRTRAAEELGITRRTIFNKIREFELQGL